jgi:hypothetical protein
LVARKQPPRAIENTACSPIAVHATTTVHAAAAANLPRAPGMLHVCTAVMLRRKTLNSKNSCPWWYLLSVGVFG